MLRVCNKSLVAIDGFGCSILPELLSLSSSSPLLRNALFDIATQAQPTRCDPSTGTIWEPYHAALIDVQQIMSNVANQEKESSELTLTALAGASILIVLSLDGPYDDWQHHAQQVVHLVDAHGALDIAATNIGKHLLLTSGQIDISAFAIGRSTISTHAWLRWNLDELIEDFPRQFFMDFEISTGYPGQLVTLIAKLSRCADVSRSYQYSADDANEGNDTLSLEQMELQTQIETWMAPPMPNGMPGAKRLALLKAWKLMVLAASLYHQRRLGFYADLSKPIIGMSETAHLAIVEEIVTGIEYLINAFKLNGTTIANAMAWPLAVASSECIGQATAHLQDLVIQIIDDMCELFYMSHLKSLSLVLKKLWSTHSTSREGLPCDSFSLESVSREAGLTIALL